VSQITAADDGLGDFIGNVHCLFQHKAPSGTVHGGVG
jgi:hypothetical protein